MAVDVRKVQGRRNLDFHSLDDLLADAEKLASSTNVRTLGNWNLDKLLSHIAGTFEGSIDGFGMKAPWFIRLIGPLLKNRMISRKMSPGISIPKKAEVKAFPDDGSVDKAMQHLRSAVARARSEPMEADHPAFGTMNSEEWMKLHLRHAEMHLSFAIMDQPRKN